ncbi:unnamed protein product [Sphagnum balticum]
MVFPSNSIPIMASLWAILFSVTVSAQGMMSGFNSNNQTLAGIPKSPQSNSAMIAIFGSVGGVFLLIFATVMVTAAAQTHRHPERYSPRPGGLGRPKQSRAKGLARAVLESIPIVKFGDSNDTEADAAAHKDIELADTGQANCDQSTTTDANNPATSRHTSIVTSRRGTTVTATSGLSTIEPDIQARSDGLGRYDLRPATTNDSNTAATSTDESLPLSPPYEVSDNAPGRSRFRELRRAHAGHDEYIAALRQLYHELENHLASHASTRTEAAAHQESRPTSRLRDTFHIHTGPPESQQTLPDDAVRALDSLPRIV